MIVHIFIRFFSLSLLFNWIIDVHSAAGSSVFTNSMKFKNPKVDKTFVNWKTDGENDDDGGK